MKKFSDVQQLKSLVDLAHTVKNPHFSQFQALASDLYRQELTDFMEKSGGGLVDKLKSILDRGQDHGLDEEDVKNRLYPEKTGPEKHVRPLDGPNEPDGQMSLFDEQGNPTYPTKGGPSGPKPYNPAMKEEDGGQMALDFDSPQQDSLPGAGLSGSPAAPAGPSAPGGGNTPPDPSVGPTAPPGGLPGPPSPAGPSAPKGPGAPGVPPVPATPPKSPLSPEDWAIVGPKIESLKKSLSDYVKYISLNADKFDIAYVKGINEVVKYFNNATKQYVESLKPAEQAVVPPTNPVSPVPTPEAPPSAAPTPPVAPVAPASPSVAPTPPAAPKAPAAPVAPKAPISPTPETPTAPVAPKTEEPQQAAPKTFKNKQEVYNHLVDLMRKNNKITEADIKNFASNPGNLLKLIKNAIDSTPESNPHRAEYQSLWDQITKKSGSVAKYIPIDMLAPFGKSLHNL